MQNRNTDNPGTEEFEGTSVSIPGAMEGTLEPRVEISTDLAQGDVAESSSTPVESENGESAPAAPSAAEAPPPPAAPADPASDYTDTEELVFPLGNAENVSGETVNDLEKSGTAKSSYKTEKLVVAIVNGRAEVGELRPHPENKTIYGDKESIEDLVESVQRVGRFTDEVVITQEGFVLSGNRRLRVAKQLGIDEIPARYFDSDDKVETLEALLEFNRHRVKTKVQIANEATCRLQLIALRAKAQRLDKTAGEKVESLPPTQGSKSRDKVGESMGLSGRTVSKAVATKEAVDKLRQAGRATDADEVEAALGKSFDKGHKAAIAKGVLTIQKKTRASSPALDEKSPAPPAASPAYGQTQVDVASDAPILVAAGSGIPDVSDAHRASVLPIRASAKLDTDGSVLDSDAAVELADQLMSFLRNAGPIRLTSNQRQTWRKILQEIHGLISALN